MKETRREGVRGGIKNEMEGKILKSTRQCMGDGKR